MTGNYDPGAEAVPRGDIEAGDGTVFYLQGTRCVGAVSLGRPLDIRAAQRMIDRNVRIERGLLSDERTDLRKMLLSRA
jgi:3-phenylpropionate/trans-cinnamate dioxygenase ferredoxin reductase subunit